MMSCDTRRFAQIAMVASMIGWNCGSPFPATARLLEQDASAATTPREGSAPEAPSGANGAVLASRFSQANSNLHNRLQKERDYLPAPSEPPATPRLSALAGAAFGSGVRVTYVAFDSSSHELTQFTGKYVAVLFPDDWIGEGEDQFDQNLIDRFVDRADILYESFTEIVGREPPPSDRLVTIAMVQTCGGGCGYVGYKGIEIAPDLGMRQELVRTFLDDKIPGVLFHEMAHNFDVYNAYLQHVGDGAHAWTHFMGEYSVVYSRGGRRDLSPEALMRLLLEDTFYSYLDDPLLDWETCLLNGSCWDPRAAWAGTLWRFAELHGPAAVRSYMRFVRDYVASHPTPPVDAYGKSDLHVAALAAGAGYDLSCYVDSWRWEASPTLRQEMALLYPAGPGCADLDGDGANAAVGDCDDTNSATHRGATEVADGEDNDCDGTTDDLLVVEASGGDFPSPQPIGLPGAASGRIGEGDGDLFTFAVTEPAVVSIQLCSTVGFQGWIFMYDQQGAWLGYHFVWEGSCGQGVYRLPHAGTWRFGVELNNQSIPGDYEVQIQPASRWPEPSWASIRTSQESPESLRLTAEASSPQELQPTPDLVRFWVSGFGVVGTVPYTPTASLLWQPPEGAALAQAVFRAQLLAGGPGGIPVADYTAPLSTTSVGLYEPTASQFYLRNQNSGGVADTGFGFGPGNQTWLPIAGDWDGDGDSTVGLYNSSTGRFYLRNQHAGGPADGSFQFGPGNSGWLPIAGDWDGDGEDSVGLYNRSSGRFYLRNQHAGGAADISFMFGPGNGSWIPIAGDWDGDGHDTAGLYDPSTGRFFLRNQHAGGTADAAFRFGPGNVGWLPIAGDWNRDGIETVGLYNRSSGRFYLRDHHAGGVADTTFTFGPPNSTWSPLAGNWDGQ